jgi:peptidoglycan/LPS O-acetylase OafA/YrhL
MRGEIVTLAGIPARPRNLDVDFLRGLSILWVVALHAAMSGVPDVGQLGQFIVANGYYGVTIFFVISGYLITSTSLAREGSLDKLSPVAFYSRRVARIIPCLLLIVIVLSSLHAFGVTGFVFAHGRGPAEPAFYALTFRYNYYYQMFAETADEPWRPLWSLGIEEWFYVAFPIACIALRRQAIIAAAAICMVFYGLYVRENQTLLVSLEGCADALAIGCLTAILLNWIKSPPQGWVAHAMKLLGLSIIVGCCFLGSVTVNFRFGPTIVACGAALFIFGARPDSRCRIVSALTAPIRKFGERSYEIYLFHFTVIILALPLVRGAPSHLILPAILLAIFTTGELIGRLFTDRIELHLKRILLSKKAARKVFLNGIEQSRSRELVTLKDALRSVWGSQIGGVP